MPRFKYKGDKVRFIGGSRIRKGDEFVTESPDIVDPKSRPEGIEMVDESTDELASEVATERTRKARRRTTSVDSLPPEPPPEDGI